MTIHRRGLNTGVAAAALVSCALAVSGTFAHGVAFADSAPALLVGEIPFRLERNRTVLPLVVSEAETLDILLDTGMTWDGVYLFRKEAQRHFPSEDLDSVRVGGSGSGEPTCALMADSMMLRFGSVPLHSQLVVISQSEITQGFRSDGVTGSSLFGSFVVEIDNDAKEIRLHDPESFVADSSWVPVPITLKNGIPFLDGEVSISGEDPVHLVLYIDSGSGEALELLVRATMKFAMPESVDVYHVGTGLSGDVDGKRGRIHLFSFGGFKLHAVPAAFVPAKVRSKQEDADGIIGNNALGRFNLIFDYSHGLLFLKPSKAFDVPFDMPR
ncbi:MAG: retropepsin-like domain-containing protein [Candidatus Eisenbacteria bacterium]|nr:retropepsin-like domain-containing protein [Candidatus Eisenbacteria bacterium]